MILLLFLSVGFPSYYLIEQFQHSFHERSISLLNSALDIAVGGLMNCMNSQGKKNIPAIVKRVSANDGIEHVRIFDKAGMILFSSDSTEVSKHILQVSPRTNFEKERRVEYDDMGMYSAAEPIFNKEGCERCHDTDDMGMYSAAEPIFNKEGCERCHDTDDEIIAYLGIDTEISDVEKQYYTSTLQSFYFGLTLFAVIFFLFYFLFNHLINEPLGRFIKALDQVERGNLDVRLPAIRNDEFGTIDTHFNDMVYNLDESKQRIEELHQEQLQHANKLVTLGELTAEIAHEINNPTAILSTRIDYLQMEIEDNPELKEYQDDVNVIMKQVERISKITGNILRYSKKLSTDFKRINILPIIEESVSILNPKLKKKNISLNKSFEDVPIFIQADEIQIEQLLINLIGNASDAVEQNGIIEVEIIGTNSGMVELSIIDNGPGMNKEVMDQIFSPFFTTKEGDKGTGLGLYICQNICKNHNAELKCISSVSKGTTFTIIFNNMQVA